MNSRGGKIISLGGAALSRHGRRPASSPRFQDEYQERAFYYTLELLLEDFGKPHQSVACALCEPMKVMGQHRDEVMAQFHYTLFTLFFPSFSEYLAELKETLLTSVLRRGGRDEAPSAQSWQERLNQNLEAQVEIDAKQFLDDILKHLKKFSEVEVDAERQRQVLQKTLGQLKAEWMIFPREA